MTISERIKVGIECNHIATEEVVNHWKNYFNGEKMKVGDQIWYNFSRKNNNEVELHVINIDKLDDYIISDDELSRGSKHCTVPVLKLKK